jgi:hypothetical protein
LIRFLNFKRGAYAIRIVLFAKTPSTANDALQFNAGWIGRGLKIDSLGQEEHV